jgi:hypothetical protein
MLIGSTWDLVAMVRHSLAQRVRGAVADCRWIAATVWAAYQESRRRQ